MPNNIISKIQLLNNSIYDLKDSTAKRLQSEVSDPTAVGNAISFIDTISQNQEGVITPTKKTVQSATQSAAGLMSASDKTKLDGIASGATANTGTVTSIATGTGLKGGTITGSGTISTNVPRVAKDSKSLPGANTWILEEYNNGSNYNLPSDHWYYIFSMQGSDTAYGAQLALGMTTSGAYYREYNAQIWGAWKSLIDTNAVTSVNNQTGAVSITPANIGAVASTDTININRGGTGATTAPLAKILLGVHVTLGGVSWSDVYTQLSRIDGGQSAFFWITTSEVAQFVSGSTSLAWSSGIVTNTGSGNYRFRAFTSGEMYSWSITGLTSSSSSGTVSQMTKGVTESCASNNLTNIAFDWSGSYTTGSYMLIYNSETGANGGALYKAINRANTAAWVDNEHKWARINGDTITGTLVLSKATDASGTSNNGPALIVGGTQTSAHIEIDTNEVMAKTNGTSVATLYLNSDGGNVIIGSGGLNISGALQINNTSSTGGGVRIFEDSEGGNISIYSPNNKEFQIDAYNNNVLRVYAYDNNGTIHGAEFNRLTGALSADGGFAGNATNVTGIVQVDHGGTGAANAAGARANLGLKSLRLEAGTPMDNGQVDLGLSSDKIPLSAWSTNTVCQFYVRGSTSTWWVRLIDRTTGANISGTTTPLPINVKYIDA